MITAVYNIVRVSLPDHRCLSISSVLNSVQHRISRLSRLPLPQLNSTVRRSTRSISGSMPGGIKQWVAVCVIPRYERWWSVRFGRSTSTVRWQSRPSLAAPRLGRCPPRGTTETRSRYVPALRTISLLPRRELQSQTTAAVAHRIDTDITTLVQLLLEFTGRLQLGRDVIKPSDDRRIGVMIVALHNRAL